MSVKRIFVEKTDGAASAAKHLTQTINNVLKVKLDEARIIIRYDVEGLDDAMFKKAVSAVFSSPLDSVVESDSFPLPSGYKALLIEFLPGQYDRRSDNAEKCIQMLTRRDKPTVRCATLYLFGKNISDADFDKIKKHLVNPVESRLALEKLPATLNVAPPAPDKVETIKGFKNLSDDGIEKMHKEIGFAMTHKDLASVRDYFKEEDRDPTETELKVLDTYWSDHCRHSTFFTFLTDIKINSEIGEVERAYAMYTDLYNKHHKGRKDKYPCLMDIATMAMRELKAQGKLDDLDESDEINACTINVKVDVNGKKEDWLVLFKNETHNHPTEIEPFGGAATCLGGGIRDPLSGRSYVYQAMRLTGAGDITAPIEKTLKGKLPQRTLTLTAADGYSSYGNQIGLTSGLINEVFHPGFTAKRMEAGYLIGAVKKEYVKREKPESGDVILLIGGKTGRDGCGGATGSSKAQTKESAEKSGAEVQKGDPVLERNIVRLFRKPEATTLIKKCNDFGAGGVSVAIGELSEGLDITLEAVPVKYEGLSATELAISESQERMAVVVDKKDVKKLQEMCAEENLNATVVAKVTNLKRMRMYYHGELVVDLKRKFLDTNGARAESKAVVNDKKVTFFKDFPAHDSAKTLINTLKSHNTASQKGLSEIFDTTIGSGTVLLPLGGKNQITPATSMVALVPMEGGAVTTTATVGSWGYNPYLMSESPFTGAIYSVLLSIIKNVAVGAPLDSIRLSFQEYFERLGDAPERWGKPVSALLGSLYAQLNMGIGSIGGKDSMSGTYENIDVPPSLISFSLGVANANDVVSNVFTEPNKTVYRYSLKRNENSIPDFDELKEFLNTLTGEIKNKNVSYTNVVEEGGAAAAIVKSALGNDIGFTFTGSKLFENLLGDILFIADDKKAFSKFDIETIGATQKNTAVKFKDSGETVSLNELKDAFLSPFIDIFPIKADEENNKVKTLAFTAGGATKPDTKKSKPKVFLPLFIGTNGEYDLAEQFEKAGAEVETLVIRNLTSKALNDSIKKAAELIEKCDILALAGGFSFGAEPDGAGKGIAIFLKHRPIMTAINALIERKGLICGFGEGFNALIKTGLLPYGKFTAQKTTSPTITRNNLDRHVSKIVALRVSSNLSPWLSELTVGETINAPISSGDGKFIASSRDISRLIKNGQIILQYADQKGKATMDGMHNPFGSHMAIAALTSPDGRIFGTSAHLERHRENTLINTPFSTDSKIFISAVKYFET